jgi:predicted polyphosphate/ATP-dependent NAD kinase
MRIDSGLPPMKMKLIVNPTAGAERAVDHVPAIAARLRARTAALDIVVTSGEGDAEHAGRQAAIDGVDTVVVAGGDGTLNEVLNGVAAVPHGLGAVTFGCCRSAPATTSRPRSACPVTSTPRSSGCSARSRVRWTSAA